MTGRTTGRDGSGDRDGPAGTVLALRALGLGDALTGIPALRGARRAWPAHRLVLAAPPATGDWLRSLGVVDDVLPAAGLDQPLAWDGPGPDVALDLHGCGPRSHRLLQALRPGRLVAFDCPALRKDSCDSVDGPGWDDGEHEVERWCRLMRTAGGGCDADDLRLSPPGPRSDVVVVHPGAASASRRWPASRWGAVVQAVAHAGRDVAVTGGADEAALCAQVAGAHPRAWNLSGRLDVPALADRVATAAAVVCGDTGVAHLATAFGTPSVLLFGPTPPTSWGPVIDVDRHPVLWPARDGYRGDPHGDTVDPALDRITVDEVTNAAEKLLRQVSESRR